MVQATFISFHQILLSLSPLRCCCCCLTGGKKEKARERGSALCIYIYISINNRSIKYYREREQTNKASSRVWGRLECLRTLSTLSLSQLSQLSLSLSLVGKKETHRHTTKDKEREVGSYICFCFIYLFCSLSFLFRQRRRRKRPVVFCFVLFSWKPQTPPTQSFHNPTTKSKTPNSQAGTTFVVVGKRINTIIRHKDG